MQSMNMCYDTYYFRGIVDILHETFIFFVEKCHIV